jgi:hypothetical protein
MSDNYEEIVKKARDRVKIAELELIEAKEELEKVFDSKYPDGRFILKRWENYFFARHGGPQFVFEMFYESCKKHVGLSNQSHWTGTKHRSSLPRHSKTTLYATLDKMLKAAKKFGFPTDLVETFVKEYNEKVI